MVGFQEVVEIWGVYWFGRRLGRGRLEFLFGKVAKGRLKMGFRRPFVWVGREVVYKTACVRNAHTLHTDSKFCVIGRLGVHLKARTRLDAGYGLLQLTNAFPYSFQIVELSFS